MSSVLSGYIYRTYLGTISHLKKNIAFVCVSFLIKYMPIIDNFVIGGGHFEFVYNHWRKKMETVVLFIYGLYIGGNEMNRALGHLCAHIG